MFKWDTLIPFYEEALGKKFVSEISWHLHIFRSHFFVLRKTAVFTLLVHMTGQLQSSLSSQCLEASENK